MHLPVMWINIPSMWNNRKNRISISNSSDNIVICIYQYNWDNEL